MESKVEEYMFEKEFGNSFSVNGLVTRGENYPLRKAMVNHDQQRIKTIRKGQASNQVDGELLKGVGTGGWQRGKSRDDWVSIHLHLLTEGATSNEVMNKG